MELFRYNPNKLDYEKIKPSSYVKFGLLLLCITFITGWSVTPKPVLKTLTPEEKLIVVREYNGFSEEKLIQQIKDLNFKFPYIVLAQTYQETGHYKSKIFKENNNLCGMKEARIRTNLAKGTRYGHAFYDDWRDSLIDYALYSSSYLTNIKTEGEYFGYLQQYYAEDPQYVERLKSLIKKYKLKSKFTNANSK